MKKILFVALAALILSACSGKLSKDEAKKEYIELIEKATDQVKDAKSLEEIEQIGEDLDKEGKELEEKVDKDVRDEVEKDADVLEALQKMMNATMEKGMEIGLSEQ